MSDPPYMPVHKHEVQSFNPDSSPQSPSQYPSLSFNASHPSLDSPDTKSERAPVKEAGKAIKVQRTTVELAKSLLLPIVAVTYLAFCYAVHNRIVPVTVNGFINTSPAHLASVKSGITSVSILIIAIGLWPLKELVSNIRSEEFFRTLHTHNNGVPLAVVNSISIPSFGLIDTMKAIIRRHCSPYLTLAFVAGFLSIATSTLAPAALSVETVLFDSDLMAFKVGSVTADSVYNVTDITPFKTNALYSNTQLAASIAWAETVLGVRYSFTQQAPGGGISPYIVPWPVDLEYGTAARWLTDVVALHPTCVWSNTNVSGTLDYRPSNISFTNVTKTIFLSDAGVDLQLSPFFSAFSSPSINMINTEIYVKNHTNQAAISDGTIGWEIGQCVSGCKSNGPDITTVVTYNFTGIPTFQMVGADQTWELAYLMCSPHPTIETREVRSDPQGVLSVHGDKKPTRQDNLKPAQTALLFSYSMADFGTNAGPSFGVGVMGSRAQAALIFGNDQINNINTTRGAFTIAPLQNQAIADSYVRLLQSITKIYMSGKFGTTYVPGRLSQPAVIFRSSMGYVAVSTALFAMLTAMILLAHFRSGKGEQFTLSRIATALDRSEIPSEFAQMKRDAESTKGLGQGGQSEEILFKAYGEKVVLLDKNDDGTLHLRVPAA